VVVDTFLKVADNNGNIVKARYCESATGVKGHGEYIIDMLRIPGRTYKFLSPRVGIMPIGNEYVGTRFCKLRKTNDL